MFTNCSHLVFCHREASPDATHNVRIERIMRRAGISAEKALEWIHRQMPQEQVEALSDFVVVNDGKAPLEPQVDTLLEQLSQSANQ